MQEIFGTDGVRGKANQDPIIPETIMKLAISSGSYFKKGKHRHTVVIAKDTRLSGYMVEPALTSGYIALGMDVMLVGPLPTPAISMLTRSLRADLGVMISASHNSYEDNGIKFFGPDGYKISSKAERIIEKNVLSDKSITLASSRNLGKARRLDDASGRYIEFVKNSFPKNIRLDTLKVVIDCANGAAYKIAPTILWELGAEVIAINNTPNGYNINLNCGATNTKNLQENVKKHKADIGIALDGDADRIIIVDEKGNLINGDQILGLLAIHSLKLGKLKNNKVVGTIMSNYGLEEFLNNQGITLLRSKVGDKNIANLMRENDAYIGGEPSGHIIINEYTPTGDGIIIGLQVLSILIQSNKKTSEIFSNFKLTPQVHESIKINNTANFSFKEKLKEYKRQVDKNISSNSRIVIRESGTEPLIRIMLEGNNINKIQKEILEIKKNLCQEINILD